MRRLRILTWQTHGSYLYYLTRAPHEFYVVSRPGRPPGYAGRSDGRDWGANVHDLPLEALPRQGLDCVLYQDDPQYFVDRERYLSRAQRALPQIYLEHDPPREHPTDTRHPVQDRNVLLVHVTHFNRLMWDNGVTPTRVIEHGVTEPPLAWSGERARGLMVANHPARRGRRLGWDLYQAASAQLPIDLVGMGEEAIAEVPHGELPRFAAPYRFLYHPARYTSLALAAVEGLMLGMPLVALASTEIAAVIRNGDTGITDTDPAALHEGMRHLLREHGAARALGARGRALARERFAIERFVADWNRVLAEAAGARAGGA